MGTGQQQPGSTVCGASPLKGDCSGVSSLFGGEVAGVPVFWSSTSTVERKSPGCVAAAKLFNVARDLYSRE